MEKQEKPDSKNKKTFGIIRWILFVPASILTNMLLRDVFETVSNIFLYSKENFAAAWATGILGAVLTAFLFVFVAHVMVPGNKRTALLVYLAVATPYLLILAFYGIKEQLEYSNLPYYNLSVDLVFIAGAWITFGILNKKPKVATKPAGI